MGLGLGSFEQLAGPATRKQSHHAIFLLEEVLRSMVQNEAGALLVGFETKFFSNETDVYIRFVPVLSRSVAVTRRVRTETYALQIAASAESRSRSTNISIR